jgi:thiamine-monophosphate kinase
MGEFELIARYFARPARNAVLGPGDDCAVIAASGADVELAVTTDMMVEGRHFVAGADPGALGHKLLAVNLSDLAAMGAVPRWALLALALPAVDDAWLAAFAHGLFALAERHGVELVGGDTTRGPRNLTVTAIGETPKGAAVTRNGARVGDEVWVSGALGDAALALMHDRGALRLAPADEAACRSRLDRPLPRVALGVALRGIASAMIDVSDGLVGDLGHVCAGSRVAARIVLDRVPASAAMQRQLAGGDRAAAIGAMLAGGDDYELCFCAPASLHAGIEAIGDALGLPLSSIGEIVPSREGRAEESAARDPLAALGRGSVTVVDGAGHPLTPGIASFDHFAGDPA